MYVYPDNQVLLSLIVIGEKGKTILLAIKSLVMFIFHQKDTVYFLAGKGVAMVAFILLLQLNLQPYCINYVSDGAKLTNECKVHIQH